MPFQKLVHFDIDLQEPAQSSIQPNATPPACSISSRTTSAKGSSKEALYFAVVSIYMVNTLSYHTHLPILSSSSYDPLVIALSLILSLHLRYRARFR